VRFAERVSLTVRLSGVMAAFGVVLFTGGGIVQLYTGHRGTPTVYTPRWQAGEEITVNGDNVIFWGRGKDLAAGDVTCMTRRDGPLPAGPPADSRDLATLEDPERGELVYLATNTYGFGFPIGSVVCDGPGLEAVLMSANPRTPLNRGLGIGFVVAGGVAALWALVTLRLTRSRDARRES